MQSQELEPRTRMKANRSWLQALVLVALLLGARANVGAVSGDLDPTFGPGGTVLTTLGRGHAVAVQADGKLVMAGEVSGGFAVMRYDSGGQLDPTFGSGGTVTTDFGATTGRTYAITLQPDGKIIVAGSVYSTHYDFVLARYTADGALDPTFGQGGKVTTDFGSSAQTRALVVQADGKIVAAGTIIENTNYSFALARYAADGTLDATFGVAGQVITTLAGDASALVLQPDGKLVVAGTADIYGSPKFVLARYQPDGTLDPTFGTTGRITTEFVEGYSGGAALVLQPDGKLVAAGDAGGGFGLVRYNADGSLDNAFGAGTGRVRTQFSYTAHCTALVLQPDGKLIAAGYVRAYPAPGDDFALAQYEADGTLDVNFGNGGKVATDFLGGYDFGLSAALQADGKLVVAGYVDEPGRGVSDFALARYTLAPGCEDHACDPCEVCDRTLGCVVPADLGCRPATSGKGALDLRRGADPGANALKSVWAARGMFPFGTFGRPTATTGGDLSLCVIDRSGGVPTLELSATAPAGRLCGMDPCWTETAHRYNYSDRGLTADGLRKLRFERKESGRSAKILTAAQGPQLDMPDLPLAPPVTVRVQRSNASSCFEATFSTPTVNDAARFKAKSD
jgi:uncharacterized delta-60 repeat protein